MISVIIPIYKVEKFIDQCITSVVKQTYTDLEIILIEDGSPDLCSKKCDEWQRRDKRIRVIHKENEGLSCARNDGLDVMAGEYVFFLDSDDYLHEKTLEILYDEMQKKNADIVSSGFTKFTDDKENSKSTDVTFLLGTNEIFFYQIVSNHVWGKLYKRELFENIRYPKNRNYEDVATTYLLYSQSKIVSHTTSGLYFYRIHPNTITGTLSEKNLLDLKWAYESVKENISNEPKCRFYLLTVLYSVYSRWMRADSSIKEHLKWDTYVRKEFSEISKDIKLTEYFGKSPMCLKLILYRLHLSKILMFLKDKLSLKN